jgi:S1-C subfamily serine protease
MVSVAPKWQTEGPIDAAGAYIASGAEMAREGPPLPKAPRSRSLQAAVMIGIALVAAIGAVVGYALLQPGSSHTTRARPLPKGTSAPGGPTNAALLAESAGKAVVDVSSVIGYQGLEALGTGMVITSNGEVLTNNHVIEGATAITVRDAGNGRSYRATVVGYDRSADIAVLQLGGASHLAKTNLGNSSVLRRKAPVVAIGNAEGIGGTPTYAGGSVSALHQTISAYDQMTGSTEQLSGLIETNAAVVSGDSGGPLVDVAHRVVGMVTAGSVGYQLGTMTQAGYAIPINEALAVARQIESGEPSGTIHIGPTPFLGVQVQAVAGASGAQIVGVVAGGPADLAGLREGDIITAVDGQSVSSPDALTTLLLERTPGESVQVTYLDPAGQAYQVAVVLGNGPPE